MNTFRIIPRIDVKGTNVVKGIHLEGLRVLGTPNNFAKYYYSQGADEIIYMDVVASLYERNSLLDVVRKTAEDVFIPITVGGGLRSINDIREALRSGADKVCMNTAVIKDNSLISQAANMFGSSTIVVALEVIRQNDGQYLVYTDNGREFTGKEAVEWAVKVEQLGAGEILLTSVDREGTGKGMDLDLIKAISKEVNIPLIVHGGVGKIGDVIDVAVSTDANAISLASILHYEGINYVEDEKDENEGNRDFLSSGRKKKNINACKINEIKQSLLDSGIDVRC
jgi:imidazole glycerol-phosphate synthase subunit HisF